MMQFDFSNVDWSDDDSSPFDQMCDDGENDDCDYTVSTACTSSSGFTTFSSTSRTPLIRFAQEDEIFDIPHVTEFSEEDKNATWYRPHEFREMKKEVQLTLATPPTSQEEDDDDFTLRGLEMKTYEGSMRRSMHKREAYAAVLGAQQQQAGYNPEFIAACYLPISSRCHCLAHSQGILDHQDAQVDTRYIEEGTQEEGGAEERVAAVPVQLAKEVIPGEDKDDDESYVVAECISIEKSFVLVNAECKLLESSCCRLEEIKVLGEMVEVIATNPPAA